MRWLGIATLFVAMPVFAADPPKREIQRFDVAAMADLLSADAVIEELGGDGYKWTEGPVWDKKNNRLLFSDIPNNRVVEWSETGKFKDFLKPAGFTTGKSFTGKEPGSNGLAFDAKGNLILCQHGDRRIARLKEGKFETVVDKYNGKRFNSPNDLVYHPNGDLYFTDPPYGLPLNDKDPAKELDFQGVYRLKPDGTLTLMTKEMSRPNGIALSPDAKTLYVANSDPAQAIWMRFPVNDDGTLGAGKVFIDVTKLVGEQEPGLPDGMKIDVQGNVWASGPGGVWIFNAKSQHLGTIKTSVPTSNVGWGDDGRTLYITANDKIIRLKTKVKGLGF